MARNRLRRPTKLARKRRQSRIRRNRRKYGSLLPKEFFKVFLDIINAPPNAPCLLDILQRMATGSEG